MLTGCMINAWFSNAMIEITKPLRIGHHFGARVIAD
jgi:hypothetical protein